MLPVKVAMKVASSKLTEGNQGNEARFQIYANTVIADCR